MYYRKSKILLTSVGDCVIFISVVKNVGYAVSAFLGINGIAYIINGDMEIVSAIGLLLMATSSFVYFFFVCVTFFGFVKSGISCAEQDDAIVLLSRYKELEKEGVLTNEEFSSFKESVLKNGNSKQASTFDELKKWKKLVDVGVISEDEFLSVKSDFLKNR